MKQQPKWVKDKDGKFKGSLGRGAATPPSKPVTPVNLIPPDYFRPETDNDVVSPRGLHRLVTKTHPTLTAANETLPHAPLDVKHPNRYPTIHQGFTVSPEPLKDLRGGWEKQIPELTRTGQEKKDWANLKSLVGKPLLVQPIDEMQLEVKRPWGFEKKWTVRVLVYSPCTNEVFDSLWQTPTMVHTFGQQHLREQLIPCRLQKTSGNKIHAFRLSPAELYSMAEFTDQHNIYPYSYEFDNPEVDGWDEPPAAFDDGGLGLGGEIDDYCVAHARPVAADRPATASQTVLFADPIVSDTSPSGRGNSHTL